MFYRVDYLLAVMLVGLLLHCFTNNGCVPHCRDRRQRGDQALRGRGVSLSKRKCLQLGSISSRRYSRRRLSVSPR